jgi:hypothetical protein
MSSADSSYGSKLAELARSVPRLAEALQQAERHRTERVAALVGGARFRGLDELLRHLDELFHAFNADPILRGIAFLIDRSRADVETAIESILSGYVAVAADAMRDVMEIDNLLLDFAVNPAHIDEWLTGRTGLGKFRAHRVRNRLHAAGEEPYAATSKSPFYQSHSENMHVNPRQNHGRGFSTKHYLWHGDEGFWDLFEHTGPLMHAIRRLTGALAPGSAADRLVSEHLSDVEEAWQRTQDMKAIHLALLEAYAKTQAVDEDTPDLST